MKEVCEELLGTVQDLRLWLEDLGQHPLPRSPAEFTRFALSRASIVILLAGSFEDYLKGCARRYVEKVNSLQIPFSDLPQHLRHHHFEGGATILKDAADKAKQKASKQKPASYEEVQRVISCLASVSVTSGRYELLWEAFAITYSNPGPRTVGDLLKRFDVQEPWPSLEAIVADPTQKQGVLLNQLHHQLDELIQSRNRCAHSGAKTEVPGLSELQSFLDTVEKLARAIEGVLEQQFAKLTLLAPSSPPPDPT